MKTEHIVLASATAQPGKEAELEAALREAVQPTRAQPGCLQFSLWRPAGAAGTLVGFERWASAEHHQAHLQGAHVQRLMSRMGGVLAAPPEIRVYEVVVA
ncbi:MAG TPA: putative quinol monooxygenase [Burkholderiales bacterium]|nr:putative quinol monooxygenase [Burkholderiales bacterium]